MGSYEFILMDNDDKPYTRHQICMFLMGYLPKNIPKALHESFLMHLYEMNLNVAASMDSLLKSSILYEFNNITLNKFSKLTTDPYDENTKKGGVISLNVKNNIILHQGSYIDLNGLGNTTYNAIYTNDTIRYDNKGCSGSNGGCITIECNKLIINKNSGIYCNGESIAYDLSFSNTNPGYGGSIHITCNELINNGNIHANDGNQEILGNGDAGHYKER